MTTIYLAIQWFLYTDHNLPELQDKPELKKQHDDSFKIESIVSIIFLSLIRVFHVIIVYMLPQKKEITYFL